jgi:Zinc carboxypeptidase
MSQPHESPDWERSYLRFDDLQRLLGSWREQFPDLLSVEPIGVSPEGREIWLATVHDRRCSTPESVAALWIDANIHATEVTSSVAALRLIWALVAPDASPQAQRVRERRTVYVVPRQNPDGAERALAQTPQLHRSRPDPSWWRQVSGITAQDVDGDGRVLLMRIPDPHGWWCRSEREPRLLRPRLPHEDPQGLDCYNILPEGLIRDAVGGEVSTPLDLNRNYPYHWRGEDEQTGAGRAPVTEPEVRAVIDAALARPNIGGYLSYHTFGGVHMFPFGDDGVLASGDRERYRGLGRVAQQLTGYPTEATLKYWGLGAVYGTSDDWFYDHLGVLAWTTEFWNPLAAAGITRTLPEYWAEWHEEDELALLDWSDREGHGGCFVDWYPFDHPQLGRVDLGGWNQFQLVNPPAHLLPDALCGHDEFAMAYALALPELTIAVSGVVRVAADVWRIDVEVENVGWLPTTVTERARH